MSEGGVRVPDAKDLKRAVLRIAKGTGLTAGIRDSRWRRHRLLILCYHGISLRDEHEWNPELYMTPAMFRARMELVARKGYRVLPLGEAVARLYAGDLPPRSVALTFDDGFFDFHAAALPILEEFRFPATVYLSTYYSEFNRPVFTVACSYLLWRARARATDLNGLPGLPARLGPFARGAWRAAAQAIVAAAAECRLDGAAKDRILVEVARRTGEDDAELRRRRILHLMTPDEVAALPADLVDVQLHTRRHRVPLDAALFHREITENRRDIEAMTGRGTPTHFCYPSGVHRREFLPWLRDASVVSATTCEPGIASRHDDPLLLPRLIDTTGLSPVEFESWLAGTASFLPRRRSASSSRD